MKLLQFYLCLFQGHDFRRIGMWCNGIYSETIEQCIRCKIKKEIGGNKNEV